MRHAEGLTARIPCFEGRPIVSNLNPIHIRADVAAQHKNDCNAEREAIQAHNEAIRSAAEVGDNGTRELLESILIDEQDHIDWIEAQQDQIAQMGIESFFPEDGLTVVCLLKTGIRKGWLRIKHTQDGGRVAALGQPGLLVGAQWKQSRCYCPPARKVIMRIEHVAIWTQRLEQLREFYEKFFGARASSRYVNQETQFESYFLTFSSGARLELMQSRGVEDPSDGLGFPRTGYAHMAFSVGSREQVEERTAHLSGAGYQVASAPRLTGDGYYESVVLDPDGNRIEITI